MSAAVITVPVAVLDRANQRVGEDATDTLHRVVSRAERLESLGLPRIWVAEHHAVPGIAGSAPAVLMAAVASATSRIRVGAGGFMVPSRPPLVTAEHISTLEAMHPGRIDVGLGNSLGFTAAVRRALRQEIDDRGDFERDVREVRDYLAGTASITMQPRAVGSTPLFVLTGGGRAPFAAEQGMGLVLGGPAGATDAMAQAAAAYRHGFRPSAAHSVPYVILSVQVAVAGSESAARALALPEIWSLVMSRSTGVFDPLRSASALDENALSDRERSRIERGLTGVVYGTRDHVARRLQSLVERTGVDELMVTNAMWDLDGRAETDAALAAMTRAGDERRR
ncbi:MsnO8 family LLM class oxidoreductase [uncultured Agrococcus sp.]|uniref:MsnO8 family LLM class oxidoreductase n=1 Tax=uncultured Agrococcus sp. TaxID=382258 RepID=UPI0025FBBD96|nr:MsnO8 family LLM class oxidoreductase [uncultured Agrococcus sp.]